MLNLEKGLRSMSTRTTFMSHVESLELLTDSWGNYRATQQCAWSLEIGFNSFRESWYFYKKIVFQSIYYSQFWTKLLIVQQYREHIVNYTATVASIVRQAMQLKNLPQLLATN